MERDKLTALAVKRTHKAGKRIMLNDGAGLYFRKQTATGASWMFRYKLHGRSRWMTLGNFPDMSLAEARAEARTARVHLDRGDDPLQVRRAREEEAKQRGSFRELAEEWYRGEVEGRVKHPSVPRRHLDNLLLPKLGRIPANEVTTGDIVRLLERVRVDAPTTANDTLRYARRLFDFGVRRHVIHTNPAAGLTPRLDGGGLEKPRDRFLRLDEITELFKALKADESFCRENELATRLLLALCVRKGELFAAKWGEFDLEGTTDDGAVWRLPAERSKTGMGLDIPLAPKVVAWLRELEVFAAGSEYVFPRRRRDRRARSPHLGPDTLNAALAAVDHGLKHFTVHDLRRTARSHLAALGVRSEVAELCLGHKLKGVEGTYNRHGYFQERRRALEAWTDLLIDCERGRDKATPLFQNRAPA